MLNLKRILSIVLSFLFLIAGHVSAQSASISSGANWLMANQNADKSWGGNAAASVTSFNATLETLTTLRILGSTGAPYNDGIGWLNAQTAPTVDFTTGKLIIHANAGLDILSELNQLLSWRNSEGFWGQDGDYLNAINDTALALQALKSANYTDVIVVNTAISYLLNNQNSDGGWGFSAGDDSNVYMTALVVEALSKLKTTYDLKTPIGNGVAYILSLQNTDGGFGSGEASAGGASAAPTSTVYETALSVIALIESGQGQALPLQNAINYITTNQQENGSWNDDPYSTALALRALAYVRPNLSISSSDITFSETMPTVGETVTITATVKNTGYETASNVTVRFFNGDPSSGGVQIGTDQLISVLPAGAVSQVSISQTFATTGSRTIFAQLDPTNQISETSKTDNIASARLWVATQPDLAVFSEDIKPSTFTPAPGTAFTLEYTIRNLGESATGGFDVSIYDGQPTGLPLQSVHISGIGGAEVRTGTMGVTLTGNGPHTLYIVADSGNAVTELSETNNTGAVAVNVGAAPTLADLAITPMDITLSPPRPHAGDTVQISARLRNQGAESADNFTLEIYDGEPVAGGATILSQVFTLPAGAEQTVTTNWAIPTGIHEVNVILDRGNQVAEISETNNRAVTRVMTDMVDIALSATDLVLNPGHPVVGDTVALTITAHNTGIKDTGAFNMAIYDGDPNVGAIHELPLQTFAIANIPGDGSATLTYTFTAAAQTYRFYAATDSDNTVVEMYEDNNIAIRSLKVKGSSEILGPDLIPIKIDASGTTTDPQTLAISGTVHVTIRNNGDDKITTPFNVIIFEDKDNDHLYTSQIDRKLETGRYAVGLIGRDQQPAIAIVVHDSDESSYPGERAYLLEPCGTITWGPEYIDNVDPAVHSADNNSQPVITDFDGDGEMEIVVRKTDKDIVLNGDGYLKK